MRWLVFVFVAGSGIGCLREPLGDAPASAGGESSSAESSSAESSMLAMTSGGATGSAATSEATTTASTSPTTGDAGPLGVCGDAVIGDDEWCDDGNNAPDDGCGPVCEPAGQLSWTRVFGGPALQYDTWACAAIAPDGRIILVGSTGTDVISSDILLTAFTPSGELIWQKPIAGDPNNLSGLGQVVIGSDGTIFAVGSRGTPSFSVFGVALAFSPDGEPLWAFEQPFVPDRSSWIWAVDIQDDVLVTAGSDRKDIADDTFDQFIIVRRHDPATGEVLWQQTPESTPPQAMPGGVAISGERILMAGTSWTTLDQGRFLVAYDHFGAQLWSEEAPATSITGWEAVARIGDGDFVLNGVEPGEGNDFRLVLRRVGPAGEIRWTWESELGLDILGSGVAVGPGEAIVATGSSFSGPQWHANTFRFTGDGALVWTSDDEGSHGLGAQAGGVAIGAGMIAVAGLEYLEDVWDLDARVRVFAFDD